MSSSTRPNWDAYFLAGAAWVATRADCTRSAVGAILVNAAHEVRGTGYNGAPAGVPGCASAGACPRGVHGRIPLPNLVGLHNCLCGKGWPCPDAVAPDSDYSNCIADHAERNAIRHTAPAELAGSTLYTTREPCPGCWTLIRAAGIARVVTPETDYAKP
jgi:dCMP deaminase